MRNICCIWLLSLLSLGLTAQPKSIPVRPSEALPYGPGETLSYVISYNWHAVATDVASGSMKLEREGDRWHAVLSAKSAPFFDIFFKVRERFDSWFLDGVKPLKFIRDTYEGGYYAKNLYLYDPAAGVIHADMETKSRGKEHFEIPYHDGVFDLPALLYFTRNMDTEGIRAGETYLLEFAIDEDAFSLTLTYKGRENYYVKGLGTVRTLKFGCSVVSGEMFAGGEDAILWISDDENRLPVYFYAPLKVGGVGGRLSAYKGLAHDFSSLVSRKKIK